MLHAVMLRDNSGWSSRQQPAAPNWRFPPLLSSLRSDSAILRAGVCRVCCAAVGECSSVCSGFLRTSFPYHFPRSAVFAAEISSNFVTPLHPPALRRFARPSCLAVCLSAHYSFLSIVDTRRAGSIFFQQR